MSQDEDPPEPDPQIGGEQPRRRRGRRVLAGLAVVLALLLGYLWLTREKIADDFLASQLEAMGLPATYEIARISPEEQVVRNLVVGDPKQPDLTIEEIRVRTRLHFGLPGIGRIALVRPRLWGSVRGGKPSFGSLDKVLFTGSSTEPFRLPDLDIAIEDGRALIESDYGPLGVKVDGKGAVRDGFSGALAVVSPQLVHGTCRTGKTTLYGQISVSGEKPRFKGPLRLGGLDCPDMALKLAQAGSEIDVTVDQPLDGGQAKLSLASRSAALGDNRIDGLSGTIDIAYRKGTLSARHDLEARGIVTPQVQMAAFGADGRLRAGANFTRLEVESDFDGKGIAGGGALFDSLGGAEKAGEGTLVAPLLAQIRTALAREARGSSFAGSAILRKAGKAISLVMPRAVLTGGSGQALLSVSRFQLLADGAPLPQITGNFAIGGPGLPNMAGRMERAANGALVLRVRMPEYRAGNSRIALPELALSQVRGGALRFDGEAQLSGPLPGGRADNLVLPLMGNWSANGVLSIWPTCTEVQFDRLEFANLQIDKRRLQLCPPRGRAIVQGPTGNIAVAAGMPALDVSGRLGETPIRIASGPIGLAWPGQLSARDLDVRLGPAATASQFRVTQLDARIGKDIAGTFGGSDILLAAVPLDLRDTGGKWRYAGGVLTLSEAAFRLEDREDVDRFTPLIARDGTLTLRNNVIDAVAMLREPRSDREVVQATIRHNLGTGRGYADLDVPGIVFDKALQPDTLTPLAFGVIANANGIVRGKGRIDWNPDAVTSSGSFTSDSFDFAAAFGPITGVSGTIVFSDLLGMVTAPNQRVDIASMNPGIVVDAGSLSFQLKPDHVIDITGGSWPFLGGTLRLQPVVMRMGVPETRRYVLDVEGIDAAQFIERMELANLSATGTFDGSIPLVFDENGGKIVGGRLKARPPGGNVSYVGELSYKDLSAMANYAFAMLRSLDYRDMEIGMEGPLDGEILTRVRFYGVKQGAGTKSNFISRKIAKLPIQFNVNVRAPFFQLASSFKSFYDPAYVRDPRGLGLVDAQGRPIQRLPGAVTDVPLPRQPTDPQLSGPQTIQPTESGDMR